MHRPYLRVQDDHVLLEISVSPNARRTALSGLHDGRLRLRLAAPPVDGKANDALLKWLAAELGVARSQVVLMRGEASRLKQVRLSVPPRQVLAWLASWGL